MCREFGIPIRKIGPAEINAGVKGIVGHADITAAFPADHGDHTDPGASFPWSTFIGYVQGGTTMGAPFAAENASAYGYALTQRLSTFKVHPYDTDPALTTVDNPAAVWMAKVEHFIDNPPAALGLSTEDRTAIVQELAALLLPALTTANSAMVTEAVKVAQREGTG